MHFSDINNMVPMLARRERRRLTSAYLEIIALPPDFDVEKRGPDSIAILILPICRHARNTPCIWPGDVLATIRYAGLGKWRLLHRAEAYALWLFRRIVLTKWHQFLSNMAHA